MPEPIKVPDMKFPMAGALKCPHCGSEKRVFTNYISELERKGKLAKNVYNTGLMISVPLLRAVPKVFSTHPTIPIFTAYFDICEECKTMYSTGIDAKEVPVPDVQMSRAR